MDRHSNSSSNSNLRRRGNSRPAGLSGREIGMYYKNLSQTRKEERGGVEEIKLGPSVNVPPAVLARVDEQLHNFGLKNEDERVCLEFEMHFRHLLSVSFEDFIREAESKPNDALDNNEVLNQRFKSDLLKKETTDLFRRRYEQRQKLPAMMQCDRIMDTIKDNQVVLIAGSTGCGKTTQIPQIILDDYIYSNRGSQCRIVCTQPRRISAVSVADRVAYERCENLGSSVGYQIRLESKMPREHGSILYCTTGILLQKMQTDPLMKGLTAVILDEIHERSVETDLLIALLKKIIPFRAELKVILMSATMSEEEISNYFDNCSTLHIEGTLFPVKMLYLEDIIQETGFTRFQNAPGENNRHGRQRRQPRQDAEKNFQYNAMMEPYLRQIRDRYEPQVVQALRCSDSEGCENLQFLEYLIFHICEHKPPGAILVFLPGYDKISKLNAVLQKPTLPIGQRFQQKIQIFPLHSMMPTVYQQTVFQPTAPGMRKIILSTIIAETSVTIEDVVYVINTGRTKTSSYNLESNIQTLEETWVTRANTQQRKGRAGRVQPGICYNLFTRARERTMADMPTPQILCCKLESILLNLKILHISDEYGFLKTLMSPPNPVAIKHGIQLLKRIGALDDLGILTPLGMHLARLPIDPQMAKMILMGALFRCFDPITSVAAGLSYKSPFYVPLGQEKKVDCIKKEMSANTRSDHLMIDNVLLNYREAVEDGAERDFCYKNFLSITTLNQLESMKQQFADLLRAASFVETSRRGDGPSNINSNNVPLLRAIIGAGLYPNIAHLRRVRQIKNRVHAIHAMSTPEERRVNFHPSSINSGEASFDSNYFVYFQKQKSSAVYILDSTMVFPMALLIFGDGVQTGVTPDNISYISVAKTYHFPCDQNTSRVILKLRDHLEWLMQKKALYPSPILPSSREEYLIKAIEILLSMDEVCDFEDQYLPDDEDFL